MSLIPYRASLDQFHPEVLWYPLVKRISADVRKFILTGVLTKSHKERAIIAISVENFLTLFRIKKRYWSDKDRIADRLHTIYACVWIDPPLKMLVVGGEPAKRVYSRREE
jgi:hypothetical protein